MDRQCQSYTRRLKRCKRTGTCWSAQNGRHCAQHMRELEPRNVFWMF